MKFAFSLAPVLGLILAIPPGAYGREAELKEYSFRASEASNLAVDMGRGFLFFQIKKGHYYWIPPGDNVADKVSVALEVVSHIGKADRIEMSIWILPGEEQEGETPPEVGQIVPEPRAKNLAIYRGETLHYLIENLTLVFR